MNALREERPEDTWSYYYHHHQTVFHWILITLLRVYTYSEDVFRPSYRYRSQTSVGNGTKLTATEVDLRRQQQSDVAVLLHIRAAVFCSVTEDMTVLHSIRVLWQPFELFTFLCYKDRSNEVFLMSETSKYKPGFWTVSRGRCVHPLHYVHKMNA